MSEDHTAEAGAHTATAFKAMLSAALVLADARRQHQIQQMRRWETEATDRERDAQRRNTTDATLTGIALGAPDRAVWSLPQRLSADLGTEAQQRATITEELVVVSPVEVAERWAAAQQPGTDPGVREAADERVREAGVDPEEVRGDHRAGTGADTSPGAGGAGAGGAGDTTVYPSGVWQQGSEAAKLAGQSYTRNPGSTITPGLTRRARTRTAGKNPDRTQDVGR